ncbi:MAG: LysM domain protein [Candidatus Woesebacteria bacterium GW2011_GWA1_37_8]|uniref:LysM domain protein n=2 Tax=Candidatus Woeseibacteriota TaxID=1752722 RepID=A0A0G0L8Q5_9BACT|nr:MAG: LysM domain protein [Microgenomates group bacterium GW2011_GWC1_37_12b]KKQ43858.1 MAG: LysM domain protein [Candidatus Woesebacteria bacterium GW2011_GWA1_37_8]KKQ87382.1 MAG: LysM domain protein [Candidatus Woesebacteria bacterium GW2011_GWB1_38_8b]
MLSLKLNQILKPLKFHESSLSVIFGIVFIVIIGIFVINYISKNKGEITIPTVSGENSTSLKIHKVEKGDDLWKISEKYYGTGYKWVEIAKENEIKNPGLIEVGQEIKIPETSPAVTVTVAPPKTEILTTTTSLVATEVDKAVVKADVITSETYVVEKGDNLWKICVRAYSDGYKWTDVAKANKLKNPSLILPGMSLTLPR